MKFSFMVTSTGTETSAVIYPVLDDYFSIFSLHFSARNRGIHGDVVAVQVLPKAQWRTRSGHLADSADCTGDVMTTGVVVGVLSRRDREYVASFDVRVSQCV